MRHCGRAGEQCYGPGRSLTRLATGSELDLRALVDVAALDGNLSRRRQGADVRVLVAWPRPDPTAPVGVAGSRAARLDPWHLSVSPALVEPLNSTFRCLSVPPALGVRVSDVLVEDRHRSSSPRTARHEPTRVQLTTRS